MVSCEVAYKSYSVEYRLTQFTEIYSEPEIF